jgi:uncharacterized protein YciI
MLFAIQCIDKPDHGQLRADTRPVHLDYLRSQADAVFCAGPLQDDSGAAIGSLIIMDFEDRAGAEAFAAGDPYAKAGLFSTVTITRWMKALPAD